MPAAFAPYKGYLTPLQAMRDRHRLAGFQKLAAYVLGVTHNVQVKS
jgi:hypothetical protein